MNNLSIETMTEGEIEAIRHALHAKGHAAAQKAAIAIVDFERSVLPLPDSFCNVDAERAEFITCFTAWGKLFGKQSVSAKVAAEENWYETLGANLAKYVNER